MYPRITRLLIATAVYLMASMGINSGPAQKIESSYRHGYYLFLAGNPGGCEDCYIPLLLTRMTIEELKESPAELDSVLITTYERDSIWHYDGLVRIQKSDISGAERKLRILNKTYRYQEIEAREVIKLLENPLGQIPISRVFLPAKLPAGPELKRLIEDFRAVK